MGPRPEDRGEANLGRDRRRQRVASMGPRPEDRGEAPPPTAPPLVIRLQWGHGPKTVESTSNAIAGIDLAELQWGHGPKTVESFLDPPSPRDIWSLQWGHGPKTVERTRTS